MPISTNVSSESGGYRGTITKDNVLIFDTNILATSAEVEKQLQTELHKIAAATPRITQKVSPNTIRTTNSVNILRSKNATQHNNIPVPLEDVGTYVIQPKLTVPKSVPRKCCGRS